VVSTELSSRYGISPQPRAAALADHGARKRRRGEERLAAALGKGEGEKEHLAAALADHGARADKRGKRLVVS
jgi:hypothetical protein